MRPPRLSLALFLGALVLSAGLPAPARAQWQGRLKVEYREDPTEEDFYGGGGDYVLAQVLTVVDTAQAAHPARVRIEVIESLRGDLVPGERVIAWPLIGDDDAKEFTDPDDLAPQGPLRGLPAAGVRVLLAGSRGADGTWVSDPHRRWSATDANAGRRRRRIEHWTPLLHARKKEEEREKSAQAATAAAAKAKATQDRFVRESAWLAHERAIRDAADVARLVRTSDAVLLADPPNDALVQWSGHDFTQVHLRAWMLQPANFATPADSLVRINLPAREQAAHERWVAAPPDDAPGDTVGDRLHCVVFLRADHRRNGNGILVPGLRLNDPVWGIVWADAALVRRVHAALDARGAHATEPLASCGAAIEEFVTADTAQAAGVAVRIAPVAANKRIYGAENAVFFVPRSVNGDGPAGDAPWFAGCVYPEAFYGTHEEFGRSGYAIPAARMRALVDSLATLPAVRDGHVDAVDSVSLSLRRVTTHGERVLEVTLDGATRRALARMLVLLFPDEDDLGWKVRDFWTWADPALIEVWHPKEPPRAAPPVPASDLAATDDTCGAVVGYVEDAVTGRPLDQPYVRGLFQDRAAMADHVGAYAVSRLHPGWVWLEASGLDHARGYALVRVDAGTFTPAVFQLAPRGGRPDPIRGRRTATVPVLAPFGARLTVRVRDPRGRPAARAWVLLEATGAVRGGCADAAGEQRFDLVPPGPARLLVRAAGCDLVARDVTLLATSRASIDVTLARSAERYFTR